MSEKEKKIGGAADSLVIQVEQSAASRHKQPFRPIDMQDEAPKELQHKRSKAPAVPSVTEELKSSVNTENKAKVETERGIPAEKQSHNVAKKLSSVTKRRASSPEAITLAPLAVSAKKESLAPIPAKLSSTTTEPGLSAKHAEKAKEDDESIAEDIADLRTHEVAKVSSEWSDEEEAGGLPRSESRGSRVSRAVRQLFCCGMPLDPPSEHEVSPRTEHDVV